MQKLQECSQRKTFTAPVNRNGFPETYFKKCFKATETDFSNFKKEKIYD